MAKKIKRAAQVQKMVKQTPPLNDKSCKLHCKEQGLGSQQGQFCSQSNTETTFYRTSEQGFGEDKDDYTTPFNMWEFTVW